MGKNVSVNIVRSEVEVFGFAEIFLDYDVHITAWDQMREREVERLAHYQEPKFTCRKIARLVILR